MGATRAAVKCLEDSRLSEPPVLLRNYAGRTQAEAGARLAEDVESMASAGYRLASQEWAHTIHYGMPSKVAFAIGALLTAAGWLVAPALSIVALVFLGVGLVLRRRTGELTVTWTRDGAAHAGDGPG